jgi:uncharacterized protein YheU (UPF0270 family)
MIKIPWQALSAEALNGIIDAYVLREGTEYGARDYTLDDKRAAVLAQLRNGSAVVLFDPATDTTDIRPATDI